MKSVADTLGDDGNAFLGALSEFTNPEVFKNAESFATYRILTFEVDRLDPSYQTSKARI